MATGLRIFAEVGRAVAGRDAGSDRSRSSSGAGAMDEVGGRRLTAAIGR